MLYLSAVLIIIAGAILLFAGWRAYKGLIALLGFVIGAIIGVTVMALFFTSIVFSIVGIIIGGIVGAILFRFVNFAVFPILGGMVGILIAQAIMSPTTTGFLYWLIVIICAAVAAILGLILRKVFTVAATSLIGAILIVSAIMQIVTGTKALELLQTMQFDTMPAIGIFILAVVGAIVQLSTSKKQKSKDK